MKRIFAEVMLIAAAAWAFAVPVAAQGRSAGHASAAGSMGGMHDMGAPGGEAGKSHGMSAPSTAQGPKTPGELLTHNTQLASKLTALLPAGTDLQKAAAGYRNLGQFVAAVHVSHNLGIPFASLKCTELAQAKYCPSGMTVPSKSSSLGQAIETLKPAETSSGTKAAVKQANAQAKGDMRATTSGQ